MLVSFPLCALTPLRHAPVRMQSGPSFKGGGQFEGVSGGSYQSPAMGTAPKGKEETTRPDKIDMAAAAASQAGIADEPLDSSIAGGFGKTVAFVENLRVGDGKLAGDLGFDPLQLADSSGALAWYREAEIKHSRIAMLAALGWPVAEKLNGPLAEFTGLQSLLVDGRAPSVLNGGLGGVSVVYWLFALGLGVAAESAYLDNQLGWVKTTTYVPGMVGFDPLGLDGAGTRTAEIWLGRIAMVAVAIYAVEESITKAPVV
jgi:hypothetical protein